MSRHVVARVGEIASGQRKILEVLGRRIGVFHSNGEYFASGPGEYRMTRAGEMLRCPWHGWEFDIRTGQSWCDPSKFRVKTYPVSVEPGANLAKGPYVATTFPVTVENDYVLVEL